MQTSHLVGAGALRLVRTARADTQTQRPYRRAIKVPGVTARRAHYRATLALSGILPPSFILWSSIRCFHFG